MKSPVLFVIPLALLSGAVCAADPAPRPTAPQVCQTCHKPSPNEIRGYFENVAFKSQSIQLRIDAVTEIVRFDPKTLKVTEAEQGKAVDDLYAIPKNKEVRIEYAEKDGAKIATLLSIKGPIKIAPEKLVKFEDIDRLVAMGPEKGQYTLIDSRPAPRFMEGAIPTAINLPFPAFDKFVDRLPADKSRLVIFYCSGVTCAMSPSSLKRAEAMGYTKARVYREGLPEWAQKRPSVLSAAFLKQAYVDKDIPFVLLDARPLAEAKAGFIPGSVTVTDQKTAIGNLPEKKLKAPIMVIDAKGGETAKALASAISASGQQNVMIVTGGFDAWKAAAYPYAVGDLGRMIAYVPKPRAGSVSTEEFTKLALSRSPDVLVLDVRNADEAKTGMIPGALLIPEEQLQARLAEVPKGKRILVHCANGIRAEMAYHRLKEAGYNAAFLNATIEIAGTGAFKVAAS
jgi:rhodanese-related sulfurtransferase